jgi:hypothetical protein
MNRRADRYRGLCACGDHAWAILTKGFVTFVSPEDAHFLSEANWFVSAGIKKASQQKKVFYARRKTGSKLIRLHRVITDVTTDQEIDHKDHDGLNNRRENLRSCSHSENQSNSRHRVRQSGFRGVDKHRGRWSARIFRDNKLLWLGTFNNPEEAARAYDAAAIEYYGEFATLNFPDQAERNLGCKLVVSPEAETKELAADVRSVDGLFVSDGLTCAPPTTRGPNIAREGPRIKT